MTAHKLHTADEIKSALDAVLAAEARYAEAQQTMKDANHAYFEAGQRMRAARERAAETLHGQHGAIRHGDEIWRLANGQLQHEPLRQDLDAQKDLLTAAGSAS